MHLWETRELMEYELNLLDDLRKHIVHGLLNGLYDVHTRSDFIERERLGFHGTSDDTRGRVIDDIDVDVEVNVAHRRGGL